MEKRKMEPIGRINYSAFDGINVYDINSDEIKFKTFRSHDDTIIESKMIIAQIRYREKDEEPYFITRGQKQFLDEIMRIQER